MTWRQLRRRRCGRRPASAPLLLLLLLHPLRAERKPGSPDGRRGGRVGDGGGDVCHSHSFSIFSPDAGRTVCLEGRPRDVLHSIDGGATCNFRLNFPFIALAWKTHTGAHTQRPPAELERENLERITAELTCFPVVPGAPSCQLTLLPRPCGKTTPLPPPRTGADK